MEQTEQHIISVENCRRVAATKIENVVSFSPSQLVLAYAGGRIVITGADMKITAFSGQSGQFSAVGTIGGVRYVGKGASLKQKLFR